ncbi:glycerophosphoryl diester phosphodiesterase [Micromonospora viridifaciens]|uniref:Glycerophosphoryl diester phosphodiesterase n=1 Tax=Micromonospora viridifaciens TaxID=1881 RepID=A0A1C4WR49_MICVI|nr:glycerophosphoryl diester phosphodiesterase [Micromonospora viridifaciens]
MTDASAAPRAAVAGTRVDLVGRGPARGRTPDVVGHRGSSGLAPENTVPSFRLSRVHGADRIETDVQLSADGEPFLFHDDIATRTTDVEQVFPDRAGDPVTSFTWAELSRLDAGAYFAREFTGTRIPSLRDVALAAGPRTQVNVELKSPANSSGVEQVLADALRHDPAWRGLVARRHVVVSSFDSGSLRTFASLAPEVPVLQIGAIPDDATLAEWATWAAGVVTNHLRLAPEDVQRVRRAGLSLSVYTVNDPAQMRAMMALGVDAIITDFPDVLMRLRRDTGPAPTSRRASSD